MTQGEIDRAVSRVTGESVSTIKKLGFSLLEMPAPEPPSVIKRQFGDATVGGLPNKNTFVPAAVYAVAQSACCPLRDR